MSQHNPSAKEESAYHSRMLAYAVDDFVGVTSQICLGRLVKIMNVALKIKVAEGKQTLSSLTAIGSIQWASNEMGRTKENKHDDISSGFY
jgi:hypothetical protein